MQNTNLKKAGVPILISELSFRQKILLEIKRDNS